MSEVLRGYLSGESKSLSPKLRTSVYGRDAVEEMVISRFERDPALLINKGIIIYGPTGTGKTSIFRDFMCTTRQSFPLVFAFVPTNSEHHAYDPIVPRPMIYEEFGLSEICEIYTRQRATTEIYNNANDMQVLRSLFDRVAEPKSRECLDRLMRAKDRALAEAAKCQDEFRRAEKREEIEDLFKDQLIRFYKEVINPAVGELQKMDLSQREQFAITYRYLNPRALIIFDDALTEVAKILAEGLKKKNEVIKNFFFRGRWANVTHWYAFQDSARLDTGIRRGAHISIFTDKNTAITHFTNIANGFPASEQSRALAAIDVVYSPAAPPHAKLLYSRLDKHRFYYYVAEKRDDNDVKMCPQIVWKFCQQIENKENTFDTKNPYYQKFARQIRHDH